MSGLRNDAVVHVQMLVRDTTRGPFNDLVVCYLMKALTVGMNEPYE
jgi:hypothetical protein